MDHTIKIKRALRLSTIGANHASANAMLDFVPAAIIETLPARKLAEMLDAMWQLAGNSKAVAARDAIKEGGVWDDRASRFRALA